MKPISLKNLASMDAKPLAGILLIKAYYLAVLLFAFIVGESGYAMASEPFFSRLSEVARDYVVIQIAATLFVNLIIGAYGLLPSKMKHSISKSTITGLIVTLTIVNIYYIGTLIALYFIGGVASFNFTY